MKTIIKLLIVAAIINAAARVGLVAAKYYQLKDESQQIVTFGGNSSVDDMEKHILDTATSLQVPLASDDITVTRQGLHTTITAAYTQPVEVFPNYEYPINFAFKVEATNMGSNGRTPVTGTPGLK